MKTFFISIILLIAVSTVAQPYAIGHITTTFVDVSRQRDVPVHIYYPSQTAGDDVPVATGSFPVLVFGHGFVMVWSAYENFWTALVPLGYIMVFPTTEGGTPNHGAFGEDLKFLNLRMKEEGQEAASPFYQKIAGTSALMGHSMGGGASFLGAANNNDITALINFAAAETNPSAIDTSAFINVPVLQFYGVNDGVTPPAEHQIPMYNALASDCKTIIGINGGGHCYFANSNLACSTGELFTSPQPSISRDEQHEIMFDLLIPYLDWMLKNNATQGQLFTDSLTSSPHIVFERYCPQAGIENASSLAVFKLFPNPIPSNGILNIELEQSVKAEIKIFNTVGQLVFQESIDDRQKSLQLSGLSKGVYWVTVIADNMQSHQKLVVF